MVLWGTVPPPHISGPALCCIFLYNKHCHKPMSCDEERRPVAEFMRDYIVYYSTVRCRRKESSRSLSHLLMSFLLRVSSDNGIAG